MSEKEVKAWVVFTGQTDLPWLRVLKPGFRHCFVLVHDGAHWVSLDPLANYTEVQVHHVPADFDLPGWLRDRNLEVVAAPLNRDFKKPAPFMAFTCVEAVKRVLGLHDWRVMTPWQLYRLLSTCHPGKSRDRAALCTEQTDPGFRRDDTEQEKGEFSWVA